MKRNQVKLLFVALIGMKALCSSAAFFIIKVGVRHEQLEPRERTNKFYVCDEWTKVFIGFISWNLRNLPEANKSGTKSC